MNDRSDADAYIKEKLEKAIVPESIHLARQIAADGIVDAEDGWTLMRLMDYWRGQVRIMMPTIDYNALEIYLVERLVEFDAAFDWEWPGKSPALEESVYGLYAHMYCIAHRMGIDFHAKP
jgi:hypothetical protein